MKKLIRKLDSKYIAARIMLSDLMSKEEGMETLETVIVVIIAIVVAGAVMTMIGKGSDNNTILGKIYTKIDNMINSLGSGANLSGGNGG